MLFLAKTHSGKESKRRPAAASFFKGLGVSAEPQIYPLRKDRKEK